MFSRMISKRGIYLILIPFPHRTIWHNGSFQVSAREIGSRIHALLNGEMNLNVGTASPRSNSSPKLATPASTIEAGISKIGEL
jgi:hypothetical protein